MARTRNSGEMSGKWGLSNGNRSDMAGFMAFLGLLKVLVEGYLMDGRSSDISSGWRTGKSCRITIAIQILLEFEPVCSNFLINKIWIANNFLIM